MSKAKELARAVKLLLTKGLKYLGILSRTKADIKDILLKLVKEADELGKDVEELERNITTLTELTKEQ